MFLQSKWNHYVLLNDETDDIENVLNVHRLNNHFSPQRFKFKVYILFLFLPFSLVEPPQYHSAPYASFMSQT